MERSQSDNVIGRLVDGRYEVTRRIARGGMATVYHAVDRRLDREVAVKMMHPHLAESEDFVARFRREARAAARLAHPNVVAVFDQGIWEESFYLTMEFVEGEDLRARLRREGPLPLGEALAISEAVLDALATAHRRELVHRDIKPENVMIDTEGTVKVADFGLARAVSDATGATTGTVLGTVAYLAPELVTRGETGPTVDVYAAGILLYEMITGVQPFTGELPINVAMQHVNSDVPAPSAVAHWVPTEIDDLVAALTARTPTDRIPDGAAALAMLRQVRAALSEDMLAQRETGLEGLGPLPEGSAGGEGAGTGLAGDGEAGDGVVGGGGAGGDGDAGNGMDHTAPITHRMSSGTVALPVGQLGAGPPPPPPGGAGGSGGPAWAPVGGGAGRSGRDSKGASRTGRRRFPNRAGLWAVVVLALISTLGLWYFFAGPGAYATMPNVVGKTADQATAILSEAGFLPQAVVRNHDLVPAGEVIETDPAPDAAVRRGATVMVAVSKGILMIAMPDLTSLTGRQAADILRAQGFAEPEIVEAYHDEVVQEGLISATNAADGTAVVTGTEYDHRTVVRLEVSLGREPVTTPDVRGFQQADAEAALAEVGLVPAYGEAEYSETVPTGAVISQDPLPPAPDVAESVQLYRGDTVHLILSLGPPMVEVPNLFGMVSSQAIDLLKESGLVPDPTYYWDGALDRVRFQNPEAGTMVPKGSTVAFTVF